MSKTQHRVLWAILAAAGAVGCTINGKPLAWPGGGGGGGAATGGGSGGGAGPAPGGGGEAAVAQTTPTQAGQIPAWCDVDGADRLDPLAVEYTLEHDDANSALYDLAGHFCAPDDFSRERWADLEAARVRWSAHLMMNDADWRDAVEWALRPQIERNSPSLSVDAKRPLSALDAVEQYAVIAGSYGDKAYLVDALDTRLTEAGRLAYVEDCLRRDEIGAWAICHPDVVAFDRAALIAELRDATARSGYERTTLRLTAARLAPAIEARKAAVAELVAADPGYATLFGIAERVRGEWAKRGADDPYRALALDLDDARRANSRSKFAGCAERAWDAFAGAVKTIPADRFAGLLDEPGRAFAEKAASLVLDDPSAYLAANAMVICATGESDQLDYLHRTLADELRYRPGHRGPRTASHGAMLAANVQLDDRDARIAFPAIEREWLPRNPGSMGGGKGVVAGVDKSERTSVIKFSKEMATYQECTKWKTTNRIDRIDRDGRIHYESFCVASRPKTYDKASPPQTVNNRYTAGVKAKAYVTITEDVVTAVWPKQGADKPIAVLGVVLE